MTFLESWAMVSDGAGREAYGQAGGILLPERLAAEVLDRGVELSVAIDAFAGGQGIRDMQGAWGVLTRNLITRQEAFRIAVIHAFAPFFNAPLYSGLVRRVSKAGADFFCERAMFGATDDIQRRQRLRRCAKLLAQSCDARPACRPLCRSKRPASTDCATASIASGTAALSWQSMAMSVPASSVLTTLSPGP